MHKRVSTFTAVKAVAKHQERVSSFWSLFALFVLCGLLISINTAQAVTINGTANVMVLQTIDVTEVTELDFGKITDSDGTCQMASGGNLSGSCSGSSVPAAFSITGSDGVNIQISVTPVTESGITFTPAVDGPSTISLSGGSTNINVVGTLQLNGATVGVKTLTYTLTAEYE